MNISASEKERIKKMNETALYDIGFHHSERICAEMDELLEQYKDLEYPKSIDNWVDSFQESRQKKEKRKKNIKRRIAFIQRAAVFLIMAVIALSTVTMSVDAYRIRFFNFIIDTKEKFTIVKVDEITIRDDFSKIPIDWESFYYPTFVLTDYRLKEASGNELHKRIVFSDSENKEIGFIQMAIETNIQVDTEDAIAKEVDINGYKGLITEENGYVMISWYNEESMFMIDGLESINDLLKMAESIQKK